MNRKYGKIMQWTNEKLGKGQLTQTSDDFKAKEYEISSKIESYERLHASCLALSKLTKATKIINFANDLSNFSDNLPNRDLSSVLSKAGDCFASYGHKLDTFEKEAQIELLAVFERNMSLIRSYQTSRKRLESKRLAYDYSQSKANKSKKEDPRVEEELRIAGFKYQESLEDVQGKMNNLIQADEAFVKGIEEYIKNQTMFLEENYKQSAAILEEMQNIASLTKNKSTIGRIRGRSSSSASPGFQNQFNMESKSDHSKTIHSYNGSRRTSVDELQDQFASMLKEKKIPKSSDRSNLQKDIYQVKYNFEPEDNTMMRIEAGEFVSVIQKHESGWYLGELCDEYGKIIKVGGRSGYFPINHAEQV